MHKTVAIFSLLSATPVHAYDQALEGRWTNPKGTVTIEVTRCGSDYCGKIVWASDEKRRKGKKIRTQVLSELRPSGEGLYKGRVLEPKRGIRGSATVLYLGPNTMQVKGCVIGGVICRRQRWTRL